MSSIRRETPGGLPEWMIEELNRAEPVPEEVSKRLDYMKPSFFEALDRMAAHRRAAAQGPRSSFIDAVFSVAGELLEKARDALSTLDAISGTAMPQPVLAGGISRGMKRPEKAPAKASPPAVPTGVGFVRGTARIDLEHHREQGATVLRINLKDLATGKEVRPFTIRMADEAGSELFEPLTILPGEQAPEFPGPNPGFYNIQITWKGGEAETRVEYR
ncbi:MAG: hypothetical protein KA184_20240 [Candidatus Hydrogenedentes bacterium]|nr:hypothetical protein [Candidatus Hydrogenedentota bacterium]